VFGGDVLFGKFRHKNYPTDKPTEQIFLGSGDVF
jgi:hypothetical protein